MNESWVVTGVGLVSAAGDSPDSLFTALERRVRLVDASTASVPIRDFDPKTHLKRKGLKDLSRTSQLACTAASFLTAGLEGLERERVGVAFGSAWGSLKTVVDFERAAHVDGPRFVDPLLFTETVANVPAGQVSIFFGWSAFNATLSSGTSSGLEAIRWALDQLEDGRATAAIAGGGDELNPPLLEVLRVDGLTAGPASSGPYQAGRSGFFSGEGASFLAIEQEGRARERGAVPHARILATASRFEGPTWTSRSAGRDDPPRPGGNPALSSLIDALLGEARLESQEIDLLVLSGNGGIRKDAEEARVVIRAFGGGPTSPPILAPKGVLGETWGASGPLAIAAGIECMSHDLVPGRSGGEPLDATLGALNLPDDVLSKAVERVLVLDSSETGHVSGLIMEAL